MVLPPPLLCNNTAAQAVQRVAVALRPDHEGSGVSRPRAHGRSHHHQHAQEEGLICQGELWSSITRGEWWWCHLTFYHKSVNNVKKASREDESSLKKKKKRAKKRIKSLKWLTTIIKKIELWKTEKLKKESPVSDEVGRKRPSLINIVWGFPGSSLGKEYTCNSGDAWDLGLIPGSGRSHGGGHGKPLQYSGLENPMDKRSLAGYSPYSHQDLDTTKATKSTCIYRV